MDAFVARLRHASRPTFHPTPVGHPPLGRFTMNRCVYTVSLSLVTLCVVGYAVASGHAIADELLPADQAIETVIDHYVDEKLDAAEIEPAPRATDTTLIRRLTLDLVGRIPTATEAQAYANSTDAEKRNALVDRLVVSDAFARHQANEFDAFLMADINASVREYLLTAFQADRGWNDIFRDVLVADQSSEAKSVAEFVKRRAKDPDKLANDVSVMFFGVNVSCAKCHDHPLVPEWTQNHFYGMKSFFSRTFENGDFIGERDYGTVTFKTTEGEEKTAQPMFLSGATVDEPDAVALTDEQRKKEKELLEKLKKDKMPPPPPKFSRRAKLVEVALRSPDNDYFSKAIVNRLWYRLMGHGLVMPIDQMHPENAASHPKLMEWLARDLVAHDYDLTRLIRGLVMSETYSRSSLWRTNKRPVPDLFAVASIRPLSPHQYATTLRLATTSPGRFATDVSAEETEARLAAVENSARNLAKRFDPPNDNFQVSVTEALLLSNSEHVMNDLLRDGGDTLVGTLKSVTDPPTLVDQAVWNVFSRAPSDDERQLLVRFCEGQDDDPLKASRQLVWSLLTSSEVRFNY